MVFSFILSVISHFPSTVSIHNGIIATFKTNALKKITKTMYSNWLCCLCITITTIIILREYVKLISYHFKLTVYFIRKKQETNLK